MLNMIGNSSLPGFLIALLNILGSLAAGMGMGLIYAFLTVTLRANQNVTGLALTTFGAELMKALMNRADAVIYLVGRRRCTAFRLPRGMTACNGWACCFSWRWRFWPAGFSSAPGRG